MNIFSLTQSLLRITESDTDDTAAELSSAPSDVQQTTPIPRTSPADQEDVTRINEELLAFVRESPSSFHAVATSVRRLRDAGFKKLEESNSFEIEPGNGYYITRGGSSLIAFFIPEHHTDDFRICASHSDSPTFKIKENPEITVEDTYTKLNTEPYGGSIYAPWFDRPLGVAGRIFARRKGRLIQRLVHMDEDMLLIPNLAIHMNRDINRSYSFNPQKDLLPLYQNKAANGSFIERIARQAKIEPSRILGHDLFLYNRQNGFIWGPHKEFISSPRLDDLQCAFSSLTGLLRADKNRHIAVHCMFDNEEVGSGTKQGAGSSFLESVLTRIMQALHSENDAFARAMPKSFLLSADNAHAVHPNHTDESDPVNRPRINGGIVIKYSAAQKYCTDGFSAAYCKMLCQKAKVPFQIFTNRSDKPGGATLGNIATTSVCMPAADIGLAQLAMHSPCETAGTKDTMALVQLMTCFFS